MITREKCLELAREAEEAATKKLQCEGEYHPDWHDVRDEELVRASVALGMEMAAKVAIKEQCREPDKRDFVNAIRKMAEEVQRG